MAVSATPSKAIGPRKPPRAGFGRGGRHRLGGRGATRAGWRGAAVGRACWRSRADATHTSGNGGRTARQHDRVPAKCPAPDSTHAGQHGRPGGGAGRARGLSGAAEEIYKPKFVFRCLNPNGLHGSQMEIYSGVTDTARQIYKCKSVTIYKCKYLAFQIQIF